jgi:hypothetical protein
MVSSSGGCRHYRDHTSEISIDLAKIDGVIVPIRLFNDMERPSAADLNRYPMQQEFKRKTSTDSVASSTVLTNDAHLFFTTVINTDYFVTAHIYYDGATQASAAGDLKMGWTAPAGATFDWVSDSLGSGTLDASAGIDTVSRTHQTLAGNPSPGTNGTGNNHVALVKGILRIGGTSGTFQFQWAQLTATATATRVFVNSSLIARRLTT